MCLLVLYYLTKFCTDIYCFVVEIVVHFLPELEKSFQVPIKLISKYVDPTHVLDPHATTVQLITSSHLTLCCTRVILVKINFFYGTLSEE